jgi:electron transport complex protein RnfB
VNLSHQILAILPQTQCTRCGFPDCAAYAQAIALDEADINQCPPGGQEGVKRIATLTGRPETPLNPLNGAEAPRSVAWIDEAWCIGCTLCFAACPTDAIIGSNKQMHTIIEDACTGCELCLPVCPVDCIHLDNVSDNHTGWQAWSQELADQAKHRYAQKQMRMASLLQQDPRNEISSAAKQSAVKAALAKAKTLTER